MRFSENYGLNLVEGSDIVNPLVQDVANYEKIDEVMKDNENAGVSKATELLTGTVHSLTRDKQGSPMFRFVATSKFTTGDTFTVDGQQVTALTTTGEPLATGAYIIGSNVLCCLTGTLLTLFVGVGGEYKSYDSERLGGKLASAFATTNEVADANNVAQAANSIAIANKKQIDSNVANIIKVGTITLNYVDGSTLSASIDLTNLAIENYDKLLSFFTVRAINGTPYSAVTNLEYYFNGSNNTLNISANGSGFVNGHLVSIAFMIIETK